MTLDDLSQTLRRMREEFPKEAALHLFGIKYSKLLDGEFSDRLVEIAEKAGGTSSLSVEIRKGVKLARYVQLK